MLISVTVWDSFPNSLGHLLLSSISKDQTDELVRLVLYFSGHRASTVKGSKGKQTEKAMCSQTEGLSSESEGKQFGRPTNFRAVQFD